MVAGVRLYIERVCAVEGEREIGDWNAAGAGVSHAFFFPSSFLAMGDCGQTDVLEPLKTEPALLGSLKGSAEGALEEREHRQLTRRPRIK